MASKEIGLQDENNSDLPPDKPKDQMKKFMRQVGDVYAPWDVPAFSGLLAPLRGVLGQLAYTQLPRDDWSPLRASVEPTPPCLFVLRQQGLPTTWVAQSLADLRLGDEVRSELGVDLEVSTNISSPTWVSSFNEVSRSPTPCPIEHL